MSSPRFYKTRYDTGGSSVGGGQTSVGAWVCPAGVKWIWVVGCGGGGGGGGGASCSSTNSASPIFVWYIACGGGGGQAAITATQMIAVVPGTSYPISIGQGGSGANNSGFGVYNGASADPSFPQHFGGICFGNAGSQGGASIFGSIVYPGGLGGRRGEVIAPSWAANEINNFIPSDNVAGLNPYGTPISATYNGIPNPTGLLSSPYTADAIVLQGAINASISLVANAALPGLSRVYRGNGLGGGGGGGGGGFSNNIYSVGGAGGQGAQGVNGYPFSLPGANGTYGGAGGGGGGGEGLDYNNTHDGSNGGNGGSGFIEISWIA